MNDLDKELLKVAGEYMEIGRKIEMHKGGEVGTIDGELPELLIAQEKIMDNLVESWIDNDRIEIREVEHPFLKVFIQQLRDLYNLDVLWDGYFDVILDGHENGGILDRGAFLRNYYELKPPYVKVGTIIPKGLKEICSEARLCYVYGQYSACVALSRTVLEIVLKDVLSIHETDKICFAMLLDKAKASTSISKKAFFRAKIIIKCANDILHKAKRVEKRHAYSALDHLVDFLEEIYLVDTTNKTSVSNTKQIKS